MLTFDLLFWITLSLVGRASRIRERVMDTGSLTTKKPVLQGGWILNYPPARFTV